MKNYENNEKNLDELNNSDKNKVDEIQNIENIYIPDGYIEKKALVNISEENKNNNKNKKNKEKSFKKLLFISCVISILGGISLGFGIGIGVPIARDIIIPRVTGNEPDIRQDLNFSNTSSIETVEAFNSLSMVDAVNKVKPSVVAISTTSKAFAGSGIYGSSIPFNIEVPSSGTGIIFDEDDERVYIVTNEHVIENSTSIFVSFNRDAEVRATLLGSDARSDLAVLYVLKSDLYNIGIEDVAVAKFGDSSEMQVGEIVIAIGNALGQGNTTTMGIVSAVNQQIPIDDRLLTVMQTDAAINPGNSGGPLINARGEVIGINTVKLAKDNVEGMGFSITSNSALPIIMQLRNQQPRVYLGIIGHDVTAQISEILNLPETGVFVQSVHEGSGAYLGGLRASDVITSLNGEPILNMQQLSEKMQTFSLGDEIILEIIRSGNESITLYITLTEF